MKRLIIVVAAALGLATVQATVAPVPEAKAVWKGTVCRNFPGPDGQGGANVNICLIVDDADFDDKIRGLMYVVNNGNTRVDLHISYMRLIRNGNTVRQIGPGVEPTFPGLDIGYATTWYNNPHGVFWSRIRVWVCFPYLAGDPCGPITIWNTDQVVYT